MLPEGSQDPFAKRAFQNKGKPPDFLKDTIQSVIQSKKNVADIQEISFLVKAFSSLNEFDHCFRPFGLFEDCDLDAHY